MWASDNILPHVRGRQMYQGVFERL